MKKVFILFLIFSFIVTSCEDATEIVQRGEINDQAVFSNVANMRLFMNETYDRLTLEQDFLTSSILSDEVALGAALASNDELRFFVLPTNGRSSAIWSNHYQLINYCNRVLRGANLFNPPANQQAEYNSILAEARALRAFAHLQLMTFFSTDMSNPDALGVMLVDFVPVPGQFIPRSTNSQLYQFIENDLDFAQQNLVPRTTPDSYKFISVDFINAVRARMYLYRKDYQRANQFADAVIGSGIQLATSTFVLPANYPSNTSIIPPSGPGTGSSSINTQPNTSAAQAVQRALFQVDQWTSTIMPPYRAMWVDAIRGEAIFAYDRQNNRTNTSSLYHTNGSYQTGAILYDMGRNLFNSYTQPLGGGAEDFRRWCFIDRSSTIRTNPETATRTNEEIVIDKYPGKVGAHTANDIKVFRMSEIFLIKAECEARLGNLSTAANLLQQLRQARNYIIGAVVPTPSYSNLTQALSDILLERRKELCFEGHRYIDLKRMGADVGVTTTDRFQRDGENSSALNPLNISITDFRFTLPIPQFEIAVNPMPQNPGY